MTPVRLLLSSLALLVACAGPGIGPGTGSATSTRSPAAPAEMALVPASRPASAMAVATRVHIGAAAPAGSEVLVPGPAGAPARVALVEVAGRAVALAATCDGSARFRRRPDPPQPGAPPPDPAWAPSGATVEADLGAASRADLWLDLAPATRACRLTVRPSGAAPYHLDLRREALARPRLAALDTGAPRCALPASGDPLVAAFRADRALSLTCPMAPGPHRLLPDALVAFDLKAEALTGRRLGAAALASGDPNLPIDFSGAPDLDLIVVSYLNFNADFTGALMARMLAHHAARGTVVRIFVADPMWGDLERALYEGLAARYPTIQILPYRYAPRPGDLLEGHLARLHRVQHVKLFATVARQPGRSVAMLGGRNLADGYVVPIPYDLSAHPDLRQYDPTRAVFAGGFHSYSDLEIAFTGDAQVRALVAHWSELWLRDPDTDAPRPGRRRAAPPPDTGPQMRHFLSVPWADAGAQEHLFADLIGAARGRIDIASPYLNPPPLIAAALDAAIARGVIVRIVTTERVREATDQFVTGLNRLFADRYAPRLAYLDHDPYPMLLHTKALVIDGRLTVLGSTNLNQRSFAHDLENGVMVLDPGLAARVTALIDGYAADARPIAPGGTVAPLVRALLRLPMVNRAF